MCEVISQVDCGLTGPFNLHKILDLAKSMIVGMR